MRFYRTVVRPAIQLLDSTDKRNGLFVAALMIMNALLDFFSIATLFAVIFLVVDPHLTSGNSVMNRLYQWGGFSSPASFTAAICGFVLLFVLAKNMVGMWITKKKAQYVFCVGSKLSIQSLVHYTQTDYLTFTNMDHTKELNCIVNHPMMGYANNILLPLLNLLSEITMGVLMVVLLASYEVTVLLVLGLILAPLTIVYKLKRKKLHAISLELIDAYPRALKYAMQAIEGLLEIKVSAKEEFFINRYKQANERLVETLVQENEAQAFIARLTEVIAVFLLCALVIYATFQQGGYQKTVLLLGVYGAASFRIIPSLNRIFASILQIKTHIHLLAEMEMGARIVSKKSSIETAAYSQWKKIEFNDFSFKYPDNSTLFQKSSISIARGERIAILGKSGSGKTTLLLLLMRQIRQNEGNYLIDGVAVEHDEASRKLFGYVPQHPFMIDGTISENIAFGVPKDQVNLDRIKSILTDLDLLHWVESVPEGWNTRIGEKGTKLSGGQLQRISIARALYADASILLLDEITNQVDRVTELEVVATLEKLSHLNKTIIMVMHREDFQINFDRILVLEGGTLRERH